MKRKRASISADSLLQVAADFPHISDAPLQIASSACSKSPQTIKMRKVRGWTTKEEQQLERLLLDSVSSWGNINFFDVSYWERLSKKFNMIKQEERSATTYEDIIDKGRSLEKKYRSCVTSQAGIAYLTSNRPVLFQLFFCGECLSRVPIFPTSFAVPGPTASFVVPGPTANTSENMTISSDACTDGGNTSSRAADKMMEVLGQLRNAGKLNNAEFATLAAKRETCEDHFARWVSAQDPPVGVDVVLDVLKERLKK